MSSKAGRYIRIAGVLAAPFLLAACPQTRPLILVNNSGHQIDITYSMAQSLLPGTTSSTCSIQRGGLPRVRDEIVSHANWHAKRWSSSPQAEVNVASCIARIEIPPGSSAWIETNGFCSDYARLARQNPELRPSILSLVIQHSKGRIELGGWDVAAQFKLRSGSCIYSFGG